MPIVTQVVNMPVCGSPVNVPSDTVWSRLNAWTPTQEPLPQLGTPACNALDTGHLACILGTGAAANVAALRSMEVWQLSAGGNLVL